MDEIPQWLNPITLIAWASDNPWVMAAIGLALAALIVWQIWRGSLATRRLVINVFGIGLVVWGTMWFADWVRPSLTSDQLFTPPVVGPQPVNVAFVTQKKIEKKATYTGVVYPFESVVLNARSNGFVEKISVYPGDSVKRGQLVARLEITELAPRLDHAMANLNYLRVELKRDEDLLRQGAVTQSKLDLTRSKERVAAAKVKLLKTEIGYAKIIARSDGLISNRFVDPGQYVQKGKPIAAYDRLKQVRIRFDVAERDMAAIGVGTEVDLEFSQIPSAKFVGSAWEGRLLAEYNNPTIRARVTRVFPRLDEKTRLGVVEVLLDNPNSILRTNAYVIGHLIANQADNAWVVPVSALTPMPGGKTVVFLGPAFSDQGEVEMREVKVGLRNGEEAQLIEGIEENSFVVTSGNRSLTNGETVMVLKRTGGLF